MQSARISYNDAKRDLDRAEQLFAQGAISAAEADQARTTADLRQQDLSQAIANLELVRDGATRRQRDVSTVVQATVSGMVLEVPVEVGQSVIESNTFNEGTTIAAVADMSDLVFEGFVDESEVGRIREGMELSITIGALNDLPFKGTLEYIAPKGLVDQGTVKFEIRAALTAQSEVFVRAGLSANADIVLDRRDQVLAISERLLQFEGKTPYVEVETRSQVFERRDVQTGLSDGMNIEVLSGVTADDAIKVPQG